jgi:glucose-6-phosphate 1-dehydrogenase
MCTLVILGASGDLTKRLLMPSLLNLQQQGQLPQNFRLIGMAKEPMSRDQFRDQLSREIRQFATRQFDEGAWNHIMQLTDYISGDLTNPQDIRRLAQMIQGWESVLFYMAVAPSLFAPISEQLAAMRLNDQSGGWRRLIVEKPFGHDLKSAQELNRALHRHWTEQQIFRIDHYLGKEMVQNILAFRFGNGMFEPIWNRKYIDHVQFTVAETVGVETRGNFYDKTGALRDMVQNHLFQVLSYVAMDPPSNFHAQAIRDRKMELISSIHRMSPEEVSARVVRGQYGPGNQLPGYREEDYVARDSKTETFVAAKLYIDNWRWAGVPFFLRTGKRMAKKSAIVSIHFMPAPSVLWRDTPVHEMKPNELQFHIQPEQGVQLSFEAKVPGPTMDLRTVTMRFSYEQAFETARGTGYETLLYDAMRGDETLFSRADLVEAGWEVIQPILDTWAQQPPKDFPNYAAGSWGPEAADRLIRESQREWINPQ